MHHYCSRSYWNIAHSLEHFSNPFLSLIAVNSFVFVWLVEQPSACHACRVRVAKTNPVCVQCCTLTRVTRKKRPQAPFQQTNNFKDPFNSFKTCLNEGKKTKNEWTSLLKTHIHALSNPCILPWNRHMSEIEGYQWFLSAHSELWQWVLRIFQGAKASVFHLHKNVSLFEQPSWDGIEIRQTILSIWPWWDCFKAALVEQQYGQVVLNVWIYVLKLSPRRCYL